MFVFGERKMKNNSELIKSIIDILKTDESVYFNGPVVVKTSPNNEIFRCFGCVAKYNSRLFLMDNKDVWHEVLPEQANATPVLQSVYQRLRFMSVKVSF